MYMQLLIFNTHTHIYANIVHVFLCFTQILSHTVYCVILGVPDWTIDDVCHWLDGIGFSECITAACSIECDGKQLLAMKTEDMHVRGSEKQGKQKEKGFACFLYYLVHFNNYVHI